MSLGEGDSFAGYTILRRLGAGGMGEVYLAQHPRLPRRDALKLLTGDVTTDPSFRERFLREADLASTLWHPHIVGVHDRGESDGQLWISMDFVDGEDASALLARRYPAGMPVTLVTSIVSAVASALDYAHKQGLLHRDVKPSNILLTRGDEDGEQRILLTDFGIARTTDDNSGLTDTNMTVGTVDYASPEQLMGEAMDGRSDQYSLAATAYHLLAGVPPFKDSNAAVIIGRHINSEPPRVADTRPELASLDEVLAAALAKNPDDRFANCSDFARALTEQAVESPGWSTPAAPTTPAPVKRPAKRVEQSGAPKLLAPGWYPDPGGGGGTLYWDGRGWHTAPVPKTTPPVDVDAAGTRSNRSDLKRVVVFIVAVVVLVAVGMVVIGKRDDGPQNPTALPPTPYSEPTFPTPRRSPSPTTPSPTTLEPTPSRPIPVPIPAPPPTPTIPYWSAMIVGTCDEGLSCGVKQREAPRIDADRLYPNDLKDGMTISAVCQTFGDKRESGGYQSFSWYQLINGAYVNAIYTTLATPPIGMPEC